MKNPKEIWAIVCKPNHPLEPGETLGYLSIMQSSDKWESNNTVDILASTIPLSEESQEFFDDLVFQWSLEAIISKLEQANDVYMQIRDFSKLMVNNLQLHLVAKETTNLTKSNLMI